MDSSSPRSTPGFQSLSQAGIHLEDDALPERNGMGRALVQIRERADEPEWPPLPTLGNRGRAYGRLGFSSRTRGAKQVKVRPRGLVDRPNPEPLDPGDSAPAILKDLPPIQFSCPSCRTFLTISDPKAYDGENGPCPICGALISPPRVISPFSVLRSPA